MRRKTRSKSGMTPPNDSFFLHLHKMVSCQQPPFKTLLYESLTVQALAMPTLIWGTNESTWAQWNLLGRFVHTITHAWNVQIQKEGHPSNLYIFQLHVRDPLQPNKQQSQGLTLHLLKTNKNSTKSIEDLIDFNKNTIQLPSTIEDTLAIMLGFKWLTEILFGPKNSLTYYLDGFINMITDNKYTFKAKAVIDNELIAKILYSIGI